MDITDTIQKVKPKIEKNKLAAKIKQDNEDRKERKEEEKSNKRDLQQLKLVKDKWFSKREALMKDDELMKGIKFLESEDTHFKLCGGNKWAVYFCSDGEFKMQWWGMWMNNYIRPITLHNIDSINKRDIEKVAKMDFREELKKQILQLGAKL